MIIHIIDFNGLEGHRSMIYFQTSISYPYDHSQQFALKFMSFGHVCAATLE